MSSTPLYSPACERNREVILHELARLLPEGRVLEIASGSGMHAVYFAPRLPGRTWQPTDADALALSSIEAWRAQEPDPALLPSRRLDVTERPWPVEDADAVFCANMVHIAPWECALSLVAESARLLRSGAPLLLYGPFLEAEGNAPSNLAFDQSLRQRDPSWGVRRLNQVVEVAGTQGFALEERIAMPANNLMLCFRRQDRAPLAAG